MAAFGDAFAKARKAGKSVFSWEGKTYHTKTKEDIENTPTPPKRPADLGTEERSAPTPPPRPKSLDGDTAEPAKATTSKSVTDENELDKRIAAHNRNVGKPKK